MDARQRIIDIVTRGAENGQSLDDSLMEVYNTDADASLLALPMFQHELTALHLNVSLKRRRERAVVLYTVASGDLDGFGTEGEVVGIDTRSGKNWRRVYVQPAQQSWQEHRYWSVNCRPHTQADFDILVNAGLVKVVAS